MAAPPPARIPIRFPLVTSETFVAHDSFWLFRNTAMNPQAIVYWHWRHLDDRLELLFRVKGVNDRELARIHASDNSFVYHAQTTI
jgi:hypothetical protein